MAATSVCASARYSCRSSRCPVLPGLSRRLFTRCRSYGATRERPVGIDESISVDNLRRFIQLNLGKLNGSFHQFDAQGNLLYKHADRIFPEEKAFALRYQTAGMLETVLRQSVLGDDTGEGSPKNLKLPSRRPSVICENCLYSQQRDARVRAFHMMDPQGVVDILLVFLERRDGGLLFPSLLDDRQDSVDRSSPFHGSWKGRSVTKRSGVYGATIAVADSVASFEMDDNGQLTQVVSPTTKSGVVTTNVHWTGSLSGNLATLDGGYQLTLLPSCMYMGYPSDIAKCVAES